MNKDLDPVRYWYQVIAPAYARGFMQLDEQIAARTIDSRFKAMFPPNPEVALLLRAFIGTFEDRL